jgi:hypothetical protein
MGKKNLLKVPPEIIARIKAFGQDDVVVACAKLVQAAPTRNDRHSKFHRYRNRSSIPFAIPRANSTTLSRSATGIDFFTGAFPL